MRSNSEFSVLNAKVTPNMSKKSWCLSLLAMLTLITGAAYAQRLNGLIITGCGSGVYDSGGRCIDNPSPEQRRLQDEKNKREREQRERERMVREAKEAEVKRQVDAQVKVMGGEHRRAEAEQFVRMRDAANAARPKVNTPQTTPSQCKDTRISDGYSSGWVANVADAQAQVTQWASRCGTNGISCGPVTCRRINNELMPNRPPVIRHSCAITATRPYKSCSGSTVSAQ
jgi:hypothetical protein